jgi:3-methyladenine DNA glycosylase/8-oxoguanine DNA glycosylase
VRRARTRPDAPADVRPPADWHLIPSWTWHRAGLEPPQSRTIVQAAARRASIERAARDPASADSAVTSLRGIGAWTSAEMRIRAFGDPDAVSVGDYHLSTRWATP